MSMQVDVSFRKVPEFVSDRELSALLDRLPPWRLSKALSCRRPLDRWLCADAFLLLAESLERDFGLGGEFEFEFSRTGKPSVKGRPDIHFNLSHCPKCVCCAVADRPVGVDVEEIQYDPQLAAAVLNADELRMVRAAPDPALEFTRLWTMKESYLKMTGEGMRDDLRDVLVLNDTIFKVNADADSGFVLCCAVRE